MLFIAEATRKSAQENKLAARMAGQQTAERRGFSLAFLWPTLKSAVFLSLLSNPIQPICSAHLPVARRLQSFAFLHFVRSLFSV